MCVEAHAGNEYGEVHLIVMSRAPVAGQTKTRLTPPLTLEEARDFHAACLQDILDAAGEWRRAKAEAGLRVVCHLFITPPGSEESFTEAGVRMPDGFAIHPQQGGGLWERMAHAIVTARKPAPEGAPVILVGSDLPLLGAAQWDEALAALREHPLVFGPAFDGGYYLVGLRVPPRGLFNIGGWGHSSVLSDTLAAAEEMGLAAGLISPLPDVDTFADLETAAAHPLAQLLPGRRSLHLIGRWIRDDLAG